MNSKKKFSAVFTDGKIVNGDYEKFRQDEIWFIFTGCTAENITVYISKSEIKYIELGAEVQ